MGKLANWRWSRIAEYACRPQGLVLLLLPCALLLTLYLLAEGEPDYERLAYLTSKIDFKSGEVVDGYLVWNPKCRLVARSPLDPSITKFVRKERYQSCSSTPLLTKISREPDGKIYLVTIPEQVKRHKYVACCYAPVHRPVGPFKDYEKSFDSTVRADECENFEDKVLLNNTVEVILVRCRSSKLRKPTFSKISGQSTLNQLLSSPIYSNVHAVLNPDKVRDKLLNASSNSNQNRKLSILVIGLDSVSRLNFQRTMPLTKEYLDKRGWFEMRGYNKMGDNTYPNLMAVLSGLNESMAFSAICSPYKTYGLDKCPIIWYAFRDAGYVTGYGEDVADLSTFNYLKRGFGDPPTDYYLRPYVVATEKFLSSRRHFSIKYCTGPESSFFRILNYAQEFAETFKNQPYFGFFWTNSVSHDNVNAPSSIDSQFLSKIQEMDRSGVMNDSMVVILSDHGMRFGDFRSTVSGWYEDRLPTVYISLPPWFREQNPEAHRALSVNRNRLTSPYDLHETLRDILLRAGGTAPHGMGCPKCVSLFEDVPNVRDCSDAGVDEHWCTCTAFQNVSTSDKIVVEGAYKFLEFVDDLVKNYTKNGKRQCAKFRLKKIHRASQMEILGHNNKKNDTKALDIFYLLEVAPGGAKYETTVRYDGLGNYVIREHDVSRVNTYYKGSLCLKKGKKMFCECIK